MHVLRSAVLLAAALAVVACASSERPIPANAPPSYSERLYRPRPGETPTQPVPDDPRPAQPATPLQPPPTQQPQPDPYAHMPQGEHISLIEVRGMTCPVKCAREVKEQLMEAPGVTSVIIDFSTKVAIVHLEPGADRAILPRYVRPPYSAHVIR